MTNTTRHNAELPPPLMTSEAGSFARQTIVERKPQILRQVLDDNDYPSEIVAELGAFKAEIASSEMRLLREQAPGVTAWNRALANYPGRTWLQVPWYLAEAYFYRRLLEAVRYFQPGPWQGHDPFGKQKWAQVETSVTRLAEDWGPLGDIAPEKAFEVLLHSCLWGNRADLSNFTVHLGVHGGLNVSQERHNILIDHTVEVRQLVLAGLERVDFVNDNVGLDLLFDLALADLLLARGWVRQVVFHLKDHPFFVSDAMPQDVELTLDRLSATFDPAVQALGARLAAHLAAGRLALEADPFWTSSLMFRQFPPSLRENLGRSALVILKGDVNYRRLLDDRHWPHDLALERIAAYFPTPFLILRTLKGEIQVGLASGQAEALAAEDPTWLINGQRGIIHYCRPPGVPDSL